MSWNTYWHHNTILNASPGCEKLHSLLVVREEGRTTVKTAIAENLEPELASVLAQVPNLLIEINNLKRTLKGGENHKPLSDPFKDGRATEASYILRSYAKLFNEAEAMTFKLEQLGVIPK